MYSETTHLIISTSGQYIMRCVILRKQVRILVPDFRGIQRWVLIKGLDTGSRVRLSLIKVREYLHLYLMCTI